MQRRLASLIAFACVVLSGCSKSSTSPVVVAGPPNADSPTNVVRRLEYAWNHRDADMYGDLFTADFLVTPVSGDSAGGVISGWGRDAEEKVASSIFVGDAIHAHVSSLSLAFDPTLLTFADPTLGGGPRWHQVVSTSASLHLTLALSNGLSDPRSYIGAAHFHVVRGDSAQIPASLAAHGVVPDSTRWWIERWDDQPGTGTDSTWQQIKRLFY